MSAYIWNNIYNQMNLKRLGGIWYGKRQIWPLASNCVQARLVGALLPSTPARVA